MTPIPTQVDYSYVSCGGTLISSKFVVTAGHCVDIIPVAEVKLGAHYLSSQLNNAVYPVEKTFLHEKYDKAEIKSDIALLKLGRKVQFTNFIQPICLPIKQYWQHDFAQAIATVAGWGYYTYTTGKDPKLSTVLRKLKVKVWSQAECLDYDPEVEKQICAGGEKGKDSCNGDSGGPLVWKNNDTRKHYLIGLVSYGTPECGIGSPGIYTRITAYLPWIIARMAYEV
ncbi:hypothetical protein M8J75_012174 [Diaphorina citri]|nr:hypothetical protein M8J75_012174 [Diaphorina citri]